MRRPLVVALLGLALAANAACEKKDGARATATRVSAQSQLIGGPKAIGEIGDYLLENDQIRVIIHGPGVNRGNTLFPGAIIDVDLRRPGGGNGRGNDQLGEIAPAFLFEAFNPTEFRVTSDGSDGGDAVLTVDGVGDDLLEAVALINTGFLFPDPLRFRIEYRLAPGARHLEIVTTIINAGNTIHPLPFLDPPDLRDLGLDIPGLENLSLSVPLGHFLLFGSEQDVFATGPAGFNLRFAIEDSYDQAGGLPAFPGLVTDYLATRGEGVSYGLAAPAAESNYPNAFASLYPGQKVTDKSLLLPFLFSAVVAAYTANPPEFLIPGGEFSYTVNLVVGKGDVGSVTDVIFEEIHDVATGVFAGRLIDRQGGVPVNEARVIVTTASGDFVTEADSDAGGAFRLLLPPGEYRYRIASDARFTTEAVAMTVRSGETTSIIDFLPPPGRLLVQVRDEEGRALPCKLTVVGRFADADRGRDPRDFLYDLRLGESQRPTSFDPGRREFIEKAWYSASGRFEREIRPGAYDIVISRGPEYHSVTLTAEIAAGSHVEHTVTLPRAFATPGYVATDLHMHSANSTDSGLGLADRVISIAAEGVEFVAATDHNFVTDYSSSIANEGLTDWLVSTVGLEVTTFEMGHFNSYPLRHDSSTTRGGKFTWVGEPPGEIFRQLRELGDGESIVQVNHPRWDFLGYFNVFNLDQDLGVPVAREGLRSVFAPAGPEYALGNFDLGFDVVEIINGKRYDLFHTYRSPEVPPPPPVPDPLPPPGEVVRDSAGQVAHPGAMEDWFVLLNRGETMTGIGASDSHKLLGDEPGFPRTYVFVGEGRDGQGQVTTADVVAGLKAHNATTSLGPFVTLKVDGQPMGSLVTSSGATVVLEIEVSAPNWAPFERVIVWSNAEPILELDVPAAEARSFRHTEAVTLAADAWILVEVTGSANMFPVIPPKEFETLSPTAVVGALAAGFDLSGLSPSGNLKPAETFFATPLAFTNPVWVDRDGNGRFDPPGGSGLGQGAARKPRPDQPAPTDGAEADVRGWFDAFEEGGQ